MISIDNTPVEQALARTAPIREQAHDMLLSARAVERAALAAWYQCLVRQVINANVTRQDTMPWSIKRTVNCFIDTDSRYIEPMKLYGFVKAGWLDWLNLWIDARTQYQRENINIEAAKALELWRPQ